jgi:hypothetical protein
VLLLRAAVGSRNKPEGAMAVHRGGKERKDFGGLACYYISLGKKSYYNHSLDREILVSIFY